MKRLVLAILLGFVACAETRAASPPTPAAQQLADAIDRHLADAWKTAEITPAPLADDAEILRRLSIDLIGRIPDVRDARSFLADASPDKRAKLVDDLLAHPRHAVHFANVWRAILIPETEASNDARYFQTGFEAWLREKFRTRTSYDRLVTELIATPISADGRSAQIVLQDPTRANPLAFYAVKSAQPENLAAATTRMFLGVQMECAQCHDHPFATWSQQQFWEQAAFFAGIQREGNSLFAPLTENMSRRELTPPNKKETVQAVLLDTPVSEWKKDAGAREVLARWITSPKNPYFARAAVNRLWGQFFGVGIVEPVDDFHDEHPPSHPELLDELARRFIDSGYDIDLIVRGICLSQAYQRTSTLTHASQDQPRQFARMAIKRLSGEQFFDNLVVATGYRERTDLGPFDRDRNAPRERFLAQFSRQGKLSEPETSILQALTLMNGDFIGDATTIGKSATLTAAAEIPGLGNSQRIEMLSLATLSRPPTAAEQERLLRYLDAEKSTNATTNTALADIFWMLLNSGEFQLNH